MELDSGKKTITSPCISLLSGCFIISLRGCLVCSIYVFNNTRMVLTLGIHSRMGIVSCPKRDQDQRVSDPPRMEALGLPRFWGDAQGQIGAVGAESEKLEWTQRHTGIGRMRVLKGWVYPSPRKVRSVCVRCCGHVWAEAVHTQVPELIIGLISPHSPFSLPL